MINNIGANTASKAGNAATATVSNPSSPPPQISATGDTPAGPKGVTLALTSLARQLASSAAKADERDQTLSRSELADKAKNILDQLIGDAYVANKSKNDSEVPGTDNPELLARAKQATAFVNGVTSEKNPFDGLSREQLSNIIYDDSGTYTVNERRAAYYESHELEYEWRAKVAAQAVAEYNSTGKMTNFFQSVLDHFKSLPAIEQAQYPADYASDLADKVKQDFNFGTNTAGGNIQQIIESQLNRKLEPIQPSPAM